jgi:hypothetical protein
MRIGGEPSAATWTGRETLSAPSSAFKSNRIWLTSGVNPKL